MEMITLKKQNPNAAEILRMGSGLVLLVAGLLSAVTIVGLLPGIGLVIVGFLLLYFGRPKTIIKCNNCGGDVPARLEDKQAKCEHCDTIHPIKWTK